MSYWSQVISPSYRSTPRHLLCQEKDKSDKGIKDGLIKKSNERELSPEEERMMENSK